MSQAERKCVVCGLVHSKPRSAYCSVSCYDARRRGVVPRSLRKCDICEGVVHAPRSRYCSDECASAYLDVSAQSTRFVRKVQEMCAICGAKVENGRRKYCSAVCAFRSRHREVTHVVG